MSLDLLTDPALLGVAGTALSGWLALLGVAIRSHLRTKRAARRAEADEVTTKATADASVKRSEIVRAERVEVAALAHDVAVAPILADALKGYQAEVAAIRKDRDEDRAKLSECIEKHKKSDEAHAKCEAELAKVRDENGRVAASVAELLRERGREDTGVHELDAIARRSTTPLPQRIDLPEPRRAVRPPPLGRTPRTTIRPPDEGGDGEP